ncbi:MAG TPA: hypothetical protein VGH40_09800 [Roseiarcus sp.]|jgi:hypothetical protein
MRLALVLALTFAAASAPAFAQNCGQCADPIRINMNFQASLPIDKDASNAELAKALAGASQPLSDVVSRQCDILAEEYKGECRVVQLSVNTSINDRRIPQFVAPGDRSAQQRVNANANAMFEITPAEAAKPAAKP